MPALMQVRITKKLSDLINGMHISAFRVGDVVTVPSSAAQMLIAEGWAVPHDVRGKATERAKAADRPTRKLGH